MLLRSRDKESTLPPTTIKQNKRRGGRKKERQKERKRERDLWEVEPMQLQSPPPYPPPPPVRRAVTRFGDVRAVVAEMSQGVSRWHSHWVYSQAVYVLQSRILFHRKISSGKNHCSLFL